MSGGHYYNRAVKTGIWVVSSLKPDKYEKLAQALAEDGGIEINWPSHSFGNTVHSMAAQGWKHIVDRPLPMHLDLNFVSVAAVKHLKAVFGPNTMLTGSQNRPYQQALNRNITCEDDYRRLFDEILSLEGDTELSHIFGMAGRTSQVYLSQAPVPAAVVNKLSRNVLTVGDQDCNLLTKGRKADDIVDMVRTEIDRVLNLT